ncbi:uncharacterized protein NMK_2017 [Novimethylophilus kurashikiensis]|uniref:Uncharacterized protein n=1 Tax=Novimethylophilus kurashikiensis TaxID=1825523 RepID=A0A2R5FA45_9PROT|nr:hypothetical protein [Novimethylophilus kurashikiensis]GBG14418.1 uncharacterized protein NMK_2017 [Novimethylophilus kurashikiensis]
MTAPVRCRGCGHIYRGVDYSPNSVPNENGYCGWCCKEGVTSDAEMAKMEALNTQRHQEDEVYDH